MLRDCRSIRLTTIIIAELTVQRQSAKSSTVRSEPAQPGAAVSESIIRQTTADRRQVTVEISIVAARRMVLGVAPVASVSAAAVRTPADVPTVKSAGPIVTGRDARRRIDTGSVLDVAKEAPIGDAVQQRVQVPAAAAAAAAAVAISTTVSAVVVVVVPVIVAFTSISAVSRAAGVVRLRQAADGRDVAIDAIIVGSGIIGEVRGAVRWRHAETVGGGAQS